MTNTTVKKSKPKLEFFSKRVFLATALIGGGVYYWFSLRHYLKLVNLDSTLIEN